MNDKQTQPREYDLVLGGNNPPPTDGLVLGGIEGVKQRFASEDVEVRIAAIKDAIAFGDEGIDLVIGVLEDTSQELKINAYKLLKDRKETKIKKAILNFNSYRFFECIYTIKTPYNSPGIIIFNQDGTKILYAVDCGKFGNADGAGATIINYVEWDIIPNSSVSILSEYKHKLCREFIVSNNYYNERFEYHVDFLYLNRNAKALIAIANSNDKKDCTKINIFDINQNNLIQTIYEAKTNYYFYRKPQSIIASIANNGEILITANQSVEYDQNQARNNLLIIWDLKTGQDLHIIEQHQDTITAIAISDDNSLLVSGSEKGIIKIWDLKTYNNILTIDNTFYIVSIVIDCKNQKIIISDKYGKIRIYSPLNGQLLLDVNIYFEFPFYKYYELLAINDDGTILISTEYGNTRRNDIFVWNLITGEQLAELNHKDIHAIAISPDGQTIATMGSYEIKVWQINL